jgi:hypothetical protein
MRWALLTLLLAGAGGGYWYWRLESGPQRLENPEKPSLPPVDAAQIVSGRISMERLPREVGSALEKFSDEIVRNSEETAAKQARIHGTCAPGSAIRVISEDGSVRCQAIAHGAVSVAAVTAIPRMSSTLTEVGSVPGGIGRFQSDGEDDYLVASVSLPDGAIVTGFSYVVFDAAADVDGQAFLYRSDDQPLAAVSSQGSDERVGTFATSDIRLQKIDDVRYSYFVYFSLSHAARARLMPISASITYKLP